MKTGMGNVMVGAMLVVLMTTGIGHADLNAGLVAYYPFNRNANDESGNLNHGTVVGATLTADRFGDPDRAYWFGGLDVDNYIEVSNQARQFDLVNCWTLIAWINPEDVTEAIGAPIIWKIARPSTNEDTFALIWSTDQELLAAKLERASDDMDFVVRSKTHQPGQWYCGAGVYDGTDLKIYVNGTLESSLYIGPVTAYTGPEPLRIGNHYNSTHGVRAAFKGIIDEVRIYNRALSADEIGELVNFPPVAGAGPDQTVEATSPAGASVTLDGSGSTDPDSTAGTNDDIEFFDWYEGVTDLGSGETINYTFPLGSHTVTLEVTDFLGETDSDEVIIVVEDTTPPVISIIAPVPYGVYPVSGGLELDFSATDDVGVTELNGNLTDAAGFSGPVAPGDEPGTGVYTLVVSAKDAAGNEAEETVFFVGYDPTGGFVTGGGWIDSPSGAYTPDDPEDDDLTGKANFGFISKYKKGASVPTGQTEFVFQAGDLNFHSSSYDWLVVAGAKAMFKGVGTINGAGDYGFMLSAVDAALTPSTSEDRFRIKIWDKNAGDIVVYDNQMGDDDNADVTTAIGGGSIVIHTK